jgi:uncharacterized protein (DUF952 family)
MTELILHIAHRDDWLAAQERGEYRAESLSSEGFIHCSGPGQVVRVADRFYTGQQGLVLLIIDPTRLDAELRWEPGTDQPDELFPHLYGPLNLGAIMRSVHFEPDPDGTFSLPALL